MTDRYVRSTDGNDADTGLTWALAKATIDGADETPDAAGDRIFVSQVHAETLGASVTWAFAGTRASPTQVLCANDAAEPPTALAATATVTMNAATSNLNINGAGLFMHGIAMTVGSGQSTTCSILLAANGAEYQHYSNCDFILASTGASSLIRCGVSAAVTPSRVVWENCDVKFAATGQGIQNALAEFVWRGGSILSGGTSPTTLFLFHGGTQRGGHIALIESVDLSNGGSGMHLFSPSQATGLMTIRNCKLPASWTGSLVTGTIYLGQRFQMINCDSGDTNYRLWVQDYFGSIKSETTLVRTGSPTDGTTNVSWQMVAVADCEYPFLTLVSPDIARWNETTGSAITVTVEILHDSVTNLQDDDIWLEVVYLGTSGFPLGAHITDKVAVLGTAADQTASSETWTTTGMTNPNKQKLAVTFTPQEKGYIVARVHLALASKTVYVDPTLVVS